MKKTISFLIISVLCVSIVFAASSAEKLYNDFSTAINNGDLNSAMKRYSELETRVAKEKSNATSSIEKAIKKNNSELYYSSLADLKRLNSYTISKEESDAFLATALANNDSTALSWLYDNSPYYRPTLTFSVSSNSKGRVSRYTSSISTAPGSEITLPTGDDLNVSTIINGQLQGWSIDKEEVTYKPGEKIVMPATDQTLYAVFASGVTFKDSETGIDEFILANQGDEIQIKQPSKEGMIFEGWYDSASGLYIAPGVESWSVKGNGASFEALWKALSISTLSTGSYSVNALPTQTQIPLTISIENNGSENLEGLKFEVTTSDDSITLIDNTAYSRILRSGSKVNFTGIKLVAPNSASGKTIDLDVKVTDNEGTIFSTTFNVKFK